jgi:hypothetical protein
MEPTVIEQLEKIFQSLKSVRETNIHLIKIPISKSILIKQFNKKKFSDFKL